MYFITHPAAFLPPQSEILRRCEAMTAKMKLLYNYLVYSLRGARNSRPPLVVLYGFAVYFNSIFSCSNRREITTFLSARILSLTTRSVLKALPFSRCFSSFFGLIFVFLIYRSIKSYISRKMRKLKASEAEQNGFSEYKKCKQCGILMHQTEHCKGKKFCSDRCRIIWWNANRDLALRASAHQQICTVCGSTFFTYHGQYCSRACYGKARSQKAGVNHG